MKEQIKYVRRGIFATGLKNLQKKKKSSIQKSYQCKELIIKVEDSHSHAGEKKPSEAHLTRSKWCIYNLNIKVFFSEK